MKGEEEAVGKKIGRGEKGRKWKRKEDKTKELRQKVCLGGGS